MTGIAEKLKDALVMFWQALDDDERKMVMYAGIYVAVNVLLAAQGVGQRRRDQRLRSQLLFELGAGTGPATSSSGGFEVRTEGPPRLT